MCTLTGCYRIRASLKRARARAMPDDAPVADINSVPTGNAVETLIRRETGERSRASSASRSRILFETRSLVNVVQLVRDTGGNTRRRLSTAIPPEGSVISAVRDLARVSRGTRAISREEINSKKRYGQTRRSVSERCALYRSR